MILLIATTNAGKLSEYRSLLGPLDLTLHSLRDYPAAPAVEEDGATFVDNARKKAQQLTDALGVPALGDDSGLEVDALAGAPGLHSARYAGPNQDAAANIDKLLTELEGVPDAERTAHFRCAIAVARPDGAQFIVEGSCSGRILRQRRGQGGFGYDPIFLYEELGQTFAELSEADKNRVSHRGKASRELLARLHEFLV